jgi:Putative collagen-binding domain of a collagenase
MQPDTSGDMLVDRDPERNLSARYSGSRALVYVPTARAVVLDMGRLTSGGRVELRRVDLRSGDSELVGTYPTEGLVAVRPSGSYAAGDDDWVYVLSPAT